MIVENTQYEFPSVEIHKAVIAKVILNDHKQVSRDTPFLNFSYLIAHIKTEIAKAEDVFGRNEYPEFIKSFDLFHSEVLDDINAVQTKIEIYMRDLRKHALEEYEDLFRNEQREGGHANTDQKKKRKKRKKKNKDGQAAV